MRERKDRNENTAPNTCSSLLDSCLAHSCPFSHTHTHPPHPHPTQIPGHALGACKEAITKASIDALLAYRKHCAATSSSGQLILPEALKLLPLYTLSLTKSPCFRPETHPDARAAWIARLLTLPAPRLVPLIYGRMVPLHALAGRPPAAPPLPAKLWLSAEKLEGDGAYLLENGWQAWVYLGKAMPPETCMALLGEGGGRAWGGWVVGRRAGGESGWGGWRGWAALMSAAVL